MVIRNINFKSLLVAGLVGGYAMFLVDNWMAGALGLFGILPGTENAWWMLTHHIDGIVFALPFAWPVLYERLPGGGWLKGLTYGFLWWLVVVFIAASLIGGALGAENFQQTPPATVIVSQVILHLVYGFILGVLYVPSETASEVQHTSQRESADVAN